MRQLLFYFLIALFSAWPLLVSGENTGNDLKGNYSPAAKAKIQSLFQGLADGDKAILLSKYKEGAAKSVPEPLLLSVMLRLKAHIKTAHQFCLEWEQKLKSKTDSPAKIRFVRMMSEFMLASITPEQARTLFQSVHSNIANISQMERVIGVLISIKDLGLNFGQAHKLLNTFIKVNGLKEMRFIIPLLRHIKDARNIDWTKAADILLESLKKGKRAIWELYSRMGLGDRERGERGKGRDKLEDTSDNSSRGKKKGGDSQRGPK